MKDPKRLPGQTTADHAGRADPNAEFIAARSLDGRSDYQPIIVRILRALESRRARRRHRS